MYLYTRVYVCVAIIIEEKVVNFKRSRQADTEGVGGWTGRGGNYGNTIFRYEIIKKLIFKRVGNIQRKIDMQERRVGDEGSRLQSDDPQATGCQRLPVASEAGAGQGSSLVP